MAFLREVIEEEIGDNGADIETHGTHEGEFGIDHSGVAGGQHDRARMQVAVDHGFGA